MMSETELITQPVETPVDDVRGPLGDLRAMMLSLPSERMTVALAEYSERRKTFRDWLKSKLVEGVHFGFPPGCEPKFDKNGKPQVWMDGGYKTLDPKQWTLKPSLYKAGADFLCDLLGARDEYFADMDGWEQLGKPAGTYVYTCKLVSRATGEVLGDGRGSAKSGVKKRDDNAALKVAQKCAKCAAVINAWGLSDLFTQDIEDMAIPPHENPEHKADAPQSASRGDRVTAADLKRLGDRFKAWRGEDATLEAWCSFVGDVTGCEFNVRSPGAWKMSDLSLVEAKLNEAIVSETPF